MSVSEQVRSLKGKLLEVLGSPRACLSGPTGDTGLPPAVPLTSLEILEVAGVCGGAARGGAHNLD